MTIGIIGYGDFGKFIHALAKIHFPEVKVMISSSRFNRDGTTFFAFDEVCKADFLVLTVPISAFEEVVQKIMVHLGSDTVVCDVATVKKHTVEILRKNNVPQFIATHPMFGPYSYEKQGKSLKDLRIAICDSNLPAQERARVVAFFRKIELSVLELTPESHDKLIAETLFLTHLVGQIMKRGKFARTSIDTISFGFLMDAVESVAHDDALFRDVFKYNPYCADVLARFEIVEKEISDVLMRKE